MGDKTATILPVNERQIGPLIDGLNHDGERLKVWQDVVQDGEKMTASLVQRKLDESKASGQVVEGVFVIVTKPPFMGFAHSCPTAIA